MNYAVEAALQALYDRDDKLTAETVVDSARDPESPLHSHFEWDNDIAAHQYRLSQARQLIASVRIEQEDRPPTRAWVNVPSLGSYEPAQRVVRDADLRAEVVAKFRRDLARLRDRMQRFEEFADVVAAINGILEAPPVDE